MYTSIWSDLHLFHQCDIPRVRGKGAEDLGKANLFALTEIQIILGSPDIVVSRFRGSYRSKLIPLKFTISHRSNLIPCFGLLLRH